MALWSSFYAFWSSCFLYDFNLKDLISPHPLCFWVNVIYLIMAVVEHKIACSAIVAEDRSDLKTKYGVFYYQLI